MQFNSAPLVVEQNNYPIIVYDLDNKAKILLKSLAMKKCSVRLL